MFSLQGTKVKNRLILDIGCGERKVIKTAIGLDIRKTKTVDIIASARYLPFRDEVFDYVYASHVLEHFSHHKVKQVPKEWVRVLKRGGTLEIRCPDLRARAFIFALNPSWKNMRHIYGGQDHSWNYHKCGFSFGLLKNLLKEIGMYQIKRIFDWNKLIIPYKDLHITAKKSTTTPT